MKKKEKTNKTRDYKKKKKEKKMRKRCHPYCGGLKMHILKYRKRMSIYGLCKMVCDYLCVSYENLLKRLDLNMVRDATD